MLRQPNKRSKLRGFIRLSCRAGVFLAVVVAASLWADTLLRVTEHTAEFVLDANDLEAMFQQPKTEIDADMDAAAGETSPERTSDNAETDQTNRTDKSEQEEAEPVESAIPEDGDSTSAKHTSDADPATEAPTADEPPPADGGDTPPQDLTLHEDAARTLQTPMPTDTGTAGSLASFDGPGITSSGEDGPADAEPSGPVWEITFASAPTLDRLQAIPQMRLAACRSRRGFVELVLIDGRNTAEPMTVDQFVQRHPAHSLRQGILLDRSLLRPLEERLVVYGGGWELWLLVEDELLAEWTDEVLDSASNGQVAWHDMVRIAARLHLHREGDEVRCQFTVCDVESRPSLPSPSLQRNEAE